MTRHNVCTGAARGAEIWGCTTLIGHEKKAKFKAKFFLLSQKIRGARATLAPPVQPPLSVVLLR